MNGTPSGGCVGNAFMRSETLDNLRGLLNGNVPRRIFHVLPFNPPVLKQEFAECMNAFPTNHPLFFCSMYCLKRRYLAECINAFPTQNWTIRFKMLPQKRYRAGNGVTITANPRGKMAAGPPRKILIYSGSTGRGAQELWVDCPRFVTYWLRGLPDKFQFVMQRNQQERSDRNGQWKTDCN